MPDTEKMPDSVSKLWDLGNFIAGFAAAQSIAFGFMTLQKEWKSKILDGSPWVIFIITALIFIGVFLQCWAIRWCHKESINEKLWQPPEHVKDIFVKVMWGRLACVILFGVTCLMAAWGPLVDQKLPKGAGIDGLKQNLNCNEMDDGGECCGE